MSYLSKLKSPDSSFFFKPITPGEVKQEILSLPNNKSCGLYSCPTQLLKYSCNIISPALSHIFNLSVILGVYPSKLKISKITPIYKSEDETDPSNYRPISLLSNFNRIFEKLLYYRMKEFIDKNNLLYSSQYGFRKSHSTEHAVLDIVEEEHVLKASVDRVSVDTIGRYGDRHSADISTDTRPICRPRLDRVSVDMKRQACRPTPGRYFTTTRLPLGRHSADTLPTLGQHLAHLVSSCYRQSSIFPALLREVFGGRRPFLAFNSGNIHVFFLAMFFPRHHFYTSCLTIRINKCNGSFRSVLIHRGIEDEWTMHIIYAESTDIECMH